MIRTGPTARERERNGATSGESESATPIDAASFALLMERCAPFEAAPEIAVGVSGGADSLALALLAAEWAKARGGEAVGLTVDHRLRPGSRREALAVRQWMAAFGIRHCILTRRAPSLTGNIQAQAREARYALLTEWCRRAGVFHLLLGHQCEDQAETLLIRLARGSGLDGLAAMRPVSYRDGVRVVRPFLALRRRDLEAYLDARGQPWHRDPSNDDRRFARARLRPLLAAVEAAGIVGEAPLVVPRIATAAANLARARDALDAMVSRLLAAAARFHPWGMAVFDRTRLAAEPAEVGLRALARLVMAAGGALYGPRLDRLERLYDDLAAAGGRAPFKARTLAGCQLGALPSDPRAVRIWREIGAATERLPIRPRQSVLWDGRFQVRLSRLDVPCRSARGDGTGLELAALGSAGWSALARRMPGLGRSRALSGLPAGARWALPGLWQDGALVAGPAGLVPPSDNARTAEDEAGFEAVFLPRRGLDD